MLISEGEQIASIMVLFGKQQTEAAWSFPVFLLVCVCVFVCVCDIIDYEIFQQLVNGILQGLGSLGEPPST
jgi:hypothetical protein